MVLQRAKEAMAPFAPAAEPEGISHLGEVYPARRTLLSANPDTAPAALSTVRRQNPREEPGALAAPAGIRAGSGAQASSIPRPFRIHPPSLQPSYSERDEEGLRGD